MTNSPQEGLSTKESEGHFADSELIGFLIGNLDQEKRQEIVHHILVEKCSQCRDFLINVIDYTNKRDRRNSAIKHGLESFLNTVIVDNCLMEYEVLMDQEKVNVLSDAEIITEMISKTFRIDSSYIFNYCKIHDAVRREIAFLITGYIINSQKLTEKIINSKNVFDIKVAVVNAISNVLYSHINKSSTPIAFLQ